MAKKAKFENAIANWPQTTILKKEPGFHITGRYAHPSLARSMPGTYGMIGFLLGGLLLVVTANPFPPLLVAGVMWVFYSSYKSTMINMSGKKVDVKILPGQIHIR